ncbi:MAG: VWA domain-containing protein [Spirochaetes bacterium]|nr:VWA domain-containing protein [Spirochaetota bacterium]
MVRCIVITVALFLHPALCAYAELAVLPYKIENPSSDFPESAGGEYSRLLSVAALLAKENFEVTSPREIDVDLERMKLSPQKVITGEDLDLLGKSRRIDHFLVGSLRRVGGEYRSESVLYSVRERKIVARARVKSDNLFTLAEKEVGEALVPFRNRSPVAGGGTSGDMDILFLIDLSYAMNRDWAAVRQAIEALSAELIDSRRLDTRVYIVPFSDREDNPSASVSTNSISAIRGELNRLKPAGSASAENFLKSLKYSISSIRWRQSARKAMVVISNSNVRAKGVEQYALAARKKRIAINALSLGGIPGEASEALNRLAVSGGGLHAHASYHQRIYNASGEPVDLYMENGRLFKSRFHERGWKKGLYESAGTTGPRAKPRSFIEEIFCDEKKAPATPYAMPRDYTRAAMERIINQDELESNIETLLAGVSDAGSKRESAGRVPEGRALITDGKVSFWVAVPDPDFMAFLEGMEQSGIMAPLGVTVKKDVVSAYGITLVPVLKGLTSDYIPKCCAAELGDIVRRSDYYRTRGLFYPPVWFVNVRVASAEKFRGKKDIRND